MKVQNIICISLSVICIIYAQNPSVSINNARLVPKLLNYQGYLTDTLGIPIDDTLDMTFKVFDAVSSGNELWSETQISIPIERGVFSVILGEITPVPDSVFADFTSTWLELTLEGPQTLTPRTRITSVGYAYTSTYSDTAEYALGAAADNDWEFSGSDIYSGVSGNVGIGTASPGEKLDIDGTVNTSSCYKIEGHTMLSYINLNNTLVGVGAGENSTTSGKNNTFLGDSAGFSNISGNNNTFLGHNAGHFNTVSNNTFVGTAAGALNTTGAKNTFFGFQTGLNNTTGYDNTFSGYEAGLSNTTGYNNTFTGTEAGYQDTSGNCNTFTGCRAGYSNVDGFKNTFTGQLTGYNNTSGRHNTFTGNEAGYYNTTGMYNVFTGGEAGFNDTSGISNTFIGYGAGYYNTEGDSNVFVGHHAGFNETGSNKLYIANGKDDANVLIYGEFDSSRVGIGTTSPTQKLHVQGNARITGAVYDNNNEAGVSGQVLSTTGSGIDWTDPAPDNDWVLSSNRLYPSGSYALSMRSGNTLYGANASSHVCLGSGTVTGASGQNYSYCTVGGGGSNTASNSSATVCGGSGNTASGSQSTVGGGVDNTASGHYATVSGGTSNTASIWAAAIGGGENNTATHDWSCVPGGQDNSAAYFWAFAANYSAYAGHWMSAAFTSSHTTATNQVRAESFSTGTLNFAMDHPADPMNKILNHQAVGSDQAILVYDGTAYIEENGTVKVDLPDYFHDINKNPRIQLTGVGTYEVFVAEDINGNSFVIGGKPDTKVYWKVTGERKDIHAEIARIQTPVEQQKTGALIGHSLDDDALIGIYDDLQEKVPGRFEFKTEQGRSVHNKAMKVIDRPE